MLTFEQSGSLTLYGLGEFPYVKQPVAISEFVKDIWYRTVRIIFVH